MQGFIGGKLGQKDAVEIVDLEYGVGGVGSEECAGHEVSGGAEVNKTAIYIVAYQSEA